MTCDEVYDMLEEMGLLNERLKCKKNRKTNQAGASTKSWPKVDGSEPALDQAEASTQN